MSAGSFNPAGGLSYHLRALRFSERLWAPFRWPLGEWLLSWQPPEPTLVLVGPSGGYNLQPFLLERFERVVILEPDALAHWIFRYRLSRVPLERRPRLEFIQQDHLAFHPERLAPLLAELGPSAILFCNVIGQLRFLLDVDDSRGPRTSSVKDAVRGAIAGRSWASFHDRVSGQLAPTIEEAVGSDHRWSSSELIDAAYYAGGEAVDAALLDHDTGGFFPEHLPHVYFRWELEPGTFHLIEAVCETRA
jgi:hypothetical protein